MTSFQDTLAPACASCKLPFNEDSVISFGDALYHLGCFSCAKCKRPVDYNTNLLLLADGRPVCPDCSYICVSFRELDLKCSSLGCDCLGEEAYHANCFKCILCQNPISDLVFTQTSKGIYCTPCYERHRSERQRRKEEKERAKRKQQQQQQQGYVKEKSASAAAPKQTQTSSSPLTPASRTSRILDAQLVSDYVQIQKALSSPIDDSPPPPPPPQIPPRRDHSRLDHLEDPGKRPPTPSRSRSSSVEMTMKNGRNDKTTKQLACLTPSYSEPSLHPKSPTPPLSADSISTGPSVGTRLTSIPSADSSTASLNQTDIVLPSKHEIGTSSSSVTLDTSEIPSLNLSFFENDSSDISDLTKSLGANLFINTSSSNSNFSSLDRNATIKASKYNNSNNNSSSNERNPASAIASKISKATELLASSLYRQNNQSSASVADFPLPPSWKTTTNSPISSDLDSDDVPLDRESVMKLKAELKASNAKLAELTGSFNKIKDASKRALDEFTRAKDEFTKEVALRQQHENTIAQLRHQVAVYQQARTLDTQEFNALTKEELDRTAQLRFELERTCKELQSFRDTLSADIANLYKQKQAGLASTNGSTPKGEELEKALSAEIKSLMAERDSLRAETQQLSKIRDEVINEMIMLNTQNAELTSMNNDLSRRVTEREREAAAVMAGTSFLHPSASVSSEYKSSSSNSFSSTSPPPLQPPPMQRESSETSIIGGQRKVTSRDSFNGTQAPKLFKVKKNAVNMLTRFNKSNRTEPSISNDGGSKSSFYNLSNASVSSQSLAYVEPARRDARQGSKQSQTSVHHGSHSFQPTSFLRPAKCGVCGEKIWGLSEYRCQGCGFVTHGKCLAQAPQGCFAATTSSLDLSSPLSESEAPNKLASMFGSDLASQVSLEGGTVPLVVSKCIEAVEARGMDYEGIYRKSGGAAQMRQIQVAFEQGNGSTIDLQDENEFNDICAVTSVLKQYFRELPDPLLTFDSYQKLIDGVAMQNGPEKIEHFRMLLSQMPKANYETIKVLMQHLQRVSKHSSENRMTVKNLALVFGPTLMRDRDPNRDFLDMSYKNAVVEYFILNAHSLFD